MVAHANHVLTLCNATDSVYFLYKRLGLIPAFCMRFAELAVGQAPEDYKASCMTVAETIIEELKQGHAVLESGETQTGVARFAAGAGRHGAF